MKTAILVFLVSLLAYLLTASGHLYSPDEEVMFRMTDSLVVDHDLAIAPLPMNFATRTGIDGKEYAQYGVGQPVLAIPFYLAGRALSPMASEATWRRIYGLDPNPGDKTFAENPAASIAERFGIAFYNIFASALLAALLYGLLMEIFGHRGASLLGCLLYALGSLAWAHSRPFYSETTGALFIVLGWFALFRSCRGHMIRWNLLAGAATGYAALVRMDSVILYPATALVLLGPVLKAARDQRPRLHPFIAFCVPALCCGAILLGLNKIEYGGLFEMGYSDQAEGISFHTPLFVGLYGFLFSIGKGIFFFSPGLILGLFGWRALTIRNPWLTAAVLMATLFPLIFMSKWQNWTGGWTWGPRHIFMIHPFLAIPATAWLASNWNRTRQAVATGLLLLGMGVQIFGCSQDFVLFYQVFFRNANGRYFREQFDIFDHAYWGSYYKLYLKPNKKAEAEEVPLTFLPAPVQHSVYYPQYSQWAGYPRMYLDYGTLDNLWYRLITTPEAGKSPDGGTSE